MSINECRLAKKKAERLKEEQTTDMKRIILVCFALFAMTMAFAQGMVKGKVLSKTTNEPLEFINVTVSIKGETKILKGAITDINGNFTVNGLPNGNYTLRLSFLGYKEAIRNFSITSNDKTRNFSIIYLSDDTHTLNEVTVTGQRSEMRLEVDRKSFSVDQQISNAGGSASEALENIPSVEVDNDGNVSLRGNTSVEVWINGKSSGLTADNRAEILQQLPAESIDRIEVIDNPSAKFSAEGSAGIINIVLKKERKAGYYGSLQGSVNTRKGASSSFNINYNSSLLDAYANVGYRHRDNEGGAISRQTYPSDGRYQNYRSISSRQGNNLFSRAGLTFHASQKDDISLNGMFMFGKGNNLTTTPYHYGYEGNSGDSYMMFRRNSSDNKMRMMNIELGYRHNFTDKHFLDFNISFNRWKLDDKNIYQDSTTYLNDLAIPTEYSCQLRPLNINNKRWEAKLDYENQITEHMKLQAGYQWNYSHENTPQESYENNMSWETDNLVEVKDFYNRFIYEMNVHAIYTTLSYNIGKFGIMGGLRGEYWKVDTESYTWEQEHNAEEREPAFKKDYFQLFPSVFISYQLTPSDQIQLNYTRRLKRPWGGQLNTFKNTNDATVITYGNPLLTPEYSNSFSLNWLKTWSQHSLLASAYYRPTTDVMQRITYKSASDGLMYQTNFNVAKSTSAGLEITAKNRFFRILDLTTSANFYYYKLNGYDFDIDGQTISGESDDKFTWNVRMQASIILPFDISFQATGRYRSRQVITQGYTKANYAVDLGVRKSFLNKKLVLAVNCRDLLDSRRRKSYTFSDTFTKYQENWRHGRTVNFSLTWNFGNMKQKNKKRMDSQEQEEEFNNGYDN